MNEKQPVVFAGQTVVIYGDSLLNSTAETCKLTKLS